jgi:UDP:flavonoid glycosyltransferase YjiC (YdhE family)
VWLETWENWREDVEREGMRFAPAPEYRVFGDGVSPLPAYTAAVKVAPATRDLIREVDPDAVVVDILTVAASLAAQAEERPWATLVPHVLPVGESWLPPYSVGAIPPRTRIGAKLWSTLRPVLLGGEQLGRRELNGARVRLGLPALDHVHGGISRQLALVATFPQLEYERRVPLPGAKVTGPLLWERPFGEVELPPGDDPLILVAPSTSQDPEHSLLRAALEGLADQPVRVLAAWNRRPPARPLPEPPNSRLVEWVSYARTMPRCAAVICHAGHGTVARSLASGVPVIACPYAGDQAENGARIRWAGVGVSLPRRFQTPRGIRLAVRRLLDDPGHARRAGELRDWYEAHPGPVTAADEVEALAARGGRVVEAPRGGFEPPRTD